MGFANDILGGAATLIRAAIKSPNYRPGTSGWSINKDGSAEFRNIVLPAGSGGAVITIGPAQPGSPHAGDLWLNTSSGLEVNQWDGAAWVPYQIGTGAIAPAAITPAQIASLTASLIGQTGGVLNANPYFWGGDLAGWIGIHAASFTAIANPGSGYPWAASAAAVAGNSVYLTESSFPAVPGNQYQITGLAMTTGTHVRCGIHFYDSTGTQIGTDNTYLKTFTVATGTWTPVSNVLTAPVGTVTAKPQIDSYPDISVTLEISAVVCLPQVPGSLIQAGTVTAAQFIAGLVYAGIIDGTIVNAATFNGSVFNGTQFIANSKGIFLYNGVPAANNLYISIAPAFGTDPFGTAFPTGIKIFGTNGAQTNLENNGTAAVIMMLAAGMTHNTVQAQVAAEQQLPGAVNEVSLLALSSGKENNLDDANILLASESADGTSAGQVRIQFGLTSVLTVTKTEADITVPIVIDQWTNMTLANGWKNNAGFGVARYRKVASPPNSVEIIGAFDGTAATNNAFFTLPAGYRPASAQGFAIAPTSAADATNGRCDTSGNLTIDNIVMPVAQTFFIHALISLDA